VVRFGTRYATEADIVRDWFAAIKEASLQASGDGFMWPVFMPCLDGIAVRKDHLKPLRSM